MSLNVIEGELLEIFSKKKISSDFCDFLKSEGLLKGTSFECEVDNVSYSFDQDVDIEIIARVAQFNYRPLSTEIRVLIAVGGVTQEQNGICKPRYFFAKLYYGDTELPWSIDLDSCQFGL